MRRAAALSLVLGLSASAQGLEPGKLEAVAARIGRFMRESHVPGVSAAIVERSALVWAAGFGSADLEGGVPVREATLFRLASLSKPILATAALQLAETGRLDLDADVRRYVPSFSKKPRPITTRQLLAHLGGIRDDRADVWNGDPLVHEPESSFSGHGYGVVAAVLEAVGGRPLLDQLRERIWDPAGMNLTQEDAARELIRDRALGGYVRAPGGGLLKAPPGDSGQDVPGSGLIATASDVGRFAAAYTGRRLLSRPSIEVMLTPQRTRKGHAGGYGLGWSVAANRGRREAWHTGGGPGLSNVLLMRPDTGVAVVLLTNLEAAPGRVETARRIAEIVER